MLRDLQNAFKMLNLKASHNRETCQLLAATPISSKDGWVQKNLRPKLVSNVAAPVTVQKLPFSSTAAKLLFRPWTTGHWGTGCLTFLDKESLLDLLGLTADCSLTSASALNDYGGPWVGCLPRQQESLCHFNH